MTTLRVLPALPDIDRENSPGRGVLASARGIFPLTAMEVDADVTGLVAAITIRQTFANPFPDLLEASYIFPLPDRAAVTSFDITVAGQRIAGDIQERRAARDAYDQALAAGQRTALLEEDRPDVFTTHVGNLAPGEEATIELTLSGPIPCELGEATLRVPLVVAPRYIPGLPLEGASAGEGTQLDTDAVPDASRITPPRLAPGAPNPVRLAVTVRIDPAGLDASDLRCSLHAVSVSGELPAPTTVAVQPGQRLDRDFILRYRVASRVPGISAVVVPDAGNADEGTYVVTVVPPVAGVARPRDVVLLLDRSGSMGGWKMVAARRAAARIVDSLTSDDRFSVLAFDHVVERPPSLGDAEAGLAAATDRARYRAVEWLSRLEARGGTEMAAALASAHRDLATAAPHERQAQAEGRVQCCILVTDGQVGNEDQLLRLAADARVRIYTVGIDRAVNAGLLQRLAAATAGRCDLVESEDRLATVLADLHRRIGQPVAEVVTLRFDGMSPILATQAPPGPQDLFPGVPLTISGRYRGCPGGKAVATDAAGRWSAAAPVAAGTNRAAAALWARSHLRDLEDRYVTLPPFPPADREALAARIIEISRRHRVLCRFTAWVAIDESGERVEGTRGSVVQPVEDPSGWAARGSLTAATWLSASQPLAAFGTVANAGASGAYDATMAPIPPHQPAAPAGAPPATKLEGGPGSAASAPRSGRLFRRVQSTPSATPAQMTTPAQPATPAQPTSPTPPAPVPVDAYRERLRELIEAIEAVAEVSGPGAATHEEAIPAEPLAISARQLASDLESVIALLHSPWERIPDLLRDLADALTNGDAEVQATLQRLADLFADATSPTGRPAAATRERSFWL